MGFRVRLGPVSVGNKSAGINVGPVSASMAYKSKGGRSSASSLSTGDMFTLLMVVGFWQLTFPHFLNKQFKAEGYTNTKTMSIISKVLIVTMFVSLYYGFAGYEEQPPFYIGLLAAGVINCFMAIPGFLIYGVAYEVITRNQKPVLPEETTESTQS